MERVRPCHPVLEPPQLQPAQKEVDKTTNVKARKKKVVTTFNEQQKEEIIEFLWQNEILYSKRLAGFKDVNKKYARRGPVVAQIMITIAQNFHSPIVTYRNKAHRFFMLVSERILHVPVRNKSFAMIVIMESRTRS